MFCFEEMNPKRVLFLILVLLVATAAIPQEVAKEGATAEWDDPNPVGKVQAFNFYCGPTENVPIDPAHLVAVIQAPATEWTFELPYEFHHCRVTASDGISESLPSNEISFNFVPADYEPPLPPGNLRTIEIQVTVRIQERIQ